MDSEPILMQHLTGVPADIRRVSDIACQRFKHDYPAELLATIADKARALASPENGSAERFLGLNHLRGAQELIPEVRALMTDTNRLARLSALAGTEIGPYPLTRAAAHINFYEPGEVPIEFHTDGAAMVELIPLHTSGSTGGGGTVIYRGRPDDGLTHLRSGSTFTDDELEHVPQTVGHSVLMQGRLLLHRAEDFTDGERITLVFALEAVDQPWQDDNTLMRLLLDDPLDSVLDEWVEQAQRRAELYTAHRRAVPAA